MPTEGPHTANKNIRNQGVFKADTNVFKSNSFTVLSTFRSQTTSVFLFNPLHVFFKCARPKSSFKHSEAEPSQDIEPAARRHEIAMEVGV